MRKKLTDDALEQQDPLVERALLAMKRLGKLWTDPSTQMAIVETMMIVAHGKESVKRLRIEKLLNRADATPVLDPLTVIKIVENHAGHYQVGKLGIVYSGKTRSFLIDKGTYLSFDLRDYALADDLEVEKCIDNLTEQQIRVILSDSTVFAPILATLLEAPDVKPTSGDDIKAVPKA